MSAQPTSRLARRALMAMAASAALSLVAAGGAQAVEQPDFEAPFACGTRWEAGTNSGHSPSYYSVDFNATDDYQQPVTASAPGLVTSVEDLGSSSYGRYIVVDHGGGWTTLFAHLDTQYVSVGQWVDQGQLLGLLGTSGGSTGPHLHFEQRLNKVDQHAVFHDRSLQYNSTIRSRNCGDVPVVGDWNGDRVADVGTFRRSAGAGRFNRRMPSGDVVTNSLGTSLDDPVVGDWNGDGQDEPGVWNRMTRVFTLGTGNNAQSFRFGTRRDRAVAGDWDGDGRGEVAIFRPKTGVFRLRDAFGYVTRFRFGTVGSVPVTGDWDGDGRTDLGVYDPSTGTWTLRSGDASTTRFTFAPRAIPVAGDWNGDGISEVGAWSPATAAFRLRPTNSTRKQRLVFGRARG